MNTAADLEVRVPDIGDFDGVDVIDVIVKPGDVVGPEDPLITLESEKATMDIPSPGSGEIGEILVSVGDQVSEGALILILKTTSAAETAAAPVSEAAPTSPDLRPAPDIPAAPIAVPAVSDAGPAGTLEVRVPDIGDFDDVDVIEIIVAAGDAVAVEDPLITLESD
ncbi:MAG: biotin/lipoyl-containing protein, partial [Gammaproteobacteria bacterium]